LSFSSPAGSNRGVGGGSSSGAVVPPIDVSRCASDRRIMSSSSYPMQEQQHQQRPQQCKGQRHNVSVLFLAPDTKGDHFLNRITSMLGSRVHKQG
jgi:hypothetical protein